MQRLFLNYLVSSPKFVQKCSMKLLVWRADRLKDRNREGGGDCVLLVVINCVLISLATWKKWVFLEERFISISCDLDVFHTKKVRLFLTLMVAENRVYHKFSENRGAFCLWREVQDRLLSSRKQFLGCAVGHGVERGKAEREEQDILQQTKEKKDIQHAKMF